MLLTKIPLRTFQRIRCSSSFAPRQCTQASLLFSSPSRSSSTIISPTNIHARSSESSTVGNSNPNTLTQSGLTPNSESPESQAHERNQSLHFPKRSRKNPPRPPGGSATLPTLDASPILAPTVYIKRTSKSAHSIAGPDATKRLLLAQHKICTWIWNQVGLLGGADDLVDKSDGGVGAGPGGKEGFKYLQENNPLIFMLVGHGVPYLLFQDHVDCAWEMMNNIAPVSNDSKRGRKGNASKVDDDEIVECSFSSDTGRLDFDWINLRKRNNTIAKLSMSNDRPNESEQLYLAVMNRISTTLGTVLLTQPLPNSPIINTDKYWKKDISSPMSRWRVTFKRGFVYPPSATSSYSFDSCDQRGGGKERGEFWTTPPIVELISGHGTNGNDLEKPHESNPSFVKVTLQGIPSVFWEEEECGSDARKDDMVPVSLVFEARFEQENRSRAKA